MLAPSMDGPHTLERTRLSDRVAAELRKLVVQGAYPPGARLPSGQELAEQFGVTRLTVREALASLQATGLVETRHGSGTYVVDPAESGTLALLSDTLAAGKELTPDELRSLLELREVVLHGFADRLARGISAEHLAKLDALVAEEHRALGDTKRLAALDYDFNETLALASGNVFYALLMRSVKRAHVHLGEIVFSSCGDGKVVVETHAALVRALRKANRTAVKRTVELYVGGGNALVEKWLARQERGRAR
jgi:GntR family transcriptional repressor for pyruvate dehydrogenase complex